MQRALGVLRAAQRGVAVAKDAKRRPESWRARHGGLEDLSGTVGLSAEQRDPRESERGISGNRSAGQVYGGSGRGLVLRFGRGCGALPRFLGPIVAPGLELRLAEPPPPGPELRRLRDHATHARDDPVAIAA